MIFLRILSVKGTGNVSKSPDLIVVKFKIVSENYDYTDALNDLNYRTEELKNNIVKAGFSKDDLKTTNFNVEQKYKYKDGKNIFIGYQAQHELKLEFDYNRMVLNDLLRIMSSSKANPEFRIFFEVKDKEGYKNEVLEDAVNDAKEKAKVISTTAHVKLGKVVNIDYDFQTIPYRSNVVLKDISLSEKASNIDIVPEDVKATDYVNMEFEIEDYL